MNDIVLQNKVLNAALNPDVPIVGEETSVTRQSLHGKTVCPHRQRQENSWKAGPSVVHTDPELPLHDDVLTIGNFSKVIGSGFTSSKNIYYQKRIYDDGSDVFELDGSNYLATWKCTFRNPEIKPLTHKRRHSWRRLPPDRYTIMIQELKP